MFDLAKDQSTINERAILRKLRVWIIAFGAACLLAGISRGSDAFRAADGSAERRSDRARA